LRSIRIVSNAPDREAPLKVSTPFSIETEYWNLSADAKLNLSLVIHNENGVVVFNTTSVNERNWHGKAFPIGAFRSTCQVPGNLLNDGQYRIDLYVVQDATRSLHKEPDILSFDIEDDTIDRDGWYGTWVGAVRPALEWKTELLEV
jgi:lipopolysaccharide transport system ATP-binding protein